MIKKIVLVGCLVVFAIFVAEYIVKAFNENKEEVEKQSKRGAQAVEDSAKAQLDHAVQLDHAAASSPHSSHSSAGQKPEEERVKEALQEFQQAYAAGTLDVQARVNAFDLLGDHLAQPTVIKKLGEVLGQGNEVPDVKERAAQLLGKSEAVEAIPVLEGGLAENSKESELGTIKLGMITVASIGQVNGAEAIHALERIARARLRNMKGRKGGDICASAIGALVSIRSREAIDAVMVLYGEVDRLKPADDEEKHWKKDLEWRFDESLLQVAGTAFHTYAEWIKWWAAAKQGFGGASSNAGKEPDVATGGTDTHPPADGAAPTPVEGLAPEYAAIEAQVATSLASDQYGKALHALAGFANRHPTSTFAAKAEERIREVQAKAAEYWTGEQAKAQNLSGIGKADDAVAVYQRVIAACGEEPLLSEMVLRAKEAIKREDVGVALGQFRSAYAAATLDVHARVNALDLLRSHLAHPSVIRELGEVLGKELEHRSVKEHAAQLLGGSGAVEAIPVLEAGLEKNSKDGEVGLFIVDAIGQVKGAEAIHALERIARPRLRNLKDQKGGHIGAIAVGALVSIRSREAIDSVMVLYGDVDRLKPADDDEKRWKNDLESSFDGSLLQVAGTVFHTHAEWTKWWTSAKQGFSRSADDAGKGSDSPVKDDDAEEGAAASLLGAAKNFEANGRTDLAASRYREILQKYAHTKAAKEAEERLQAVGGK